MVGKQFVSITEYKQLLSRASLMERKLKAMENIQDLLRQKDLELRKCRNMIQQYQLALRKSELRRMESMRVIAKISETKDIYGEGRRHILFIRLFSFSLTCLLCVLTYLCIGSTYNLLSCFTL